MGAIEGLADVMKGGSLDVEGVAVKTVTAGAFLGKIIFIFAIFAAVIIFIYKFFFQFNIRVLIRRYGHGKLIDIKKDNARMFKDSQGRNQLKLFKSLKTTAIPELKYRQRIGNKDYYEFVEDDNGQLHPCDINMDVFEGKVKVEGSQDNIYTDHLGRTRYRNKDIKEQVKSLEAHYKGLIKAEKDKVKRSALKIDLKQKISMLSIEHTKTNKIQAIIKPVPQEWLAWLIQDARNQEDKLKNKDEFWAKVTAATPLITSMLLFLMFFFGFRYLADIGMSVGSGLQAIATGCLGR